MGAEEYTHTVKLQEDKLLSSKIDFLHRALLFEPLGEGRLEKIAHIARTHVYERGDTILEQGASVPTAAVREAPPHTLAPTPAGATVGKLFILWRGLIRVDRKVQEQEPPFSEVTVHVCTLTPHDFFGEVRPRRRHRAAPAAGAAHLAPELMGRGRAAQEALLHPAEAKTPATFTCETKVECLELHHRQLEPECVGAAWRGVAQACRLTRPLLVSPLQVDRRGDAVVDQPTGCEVLVRCKVPPARTGSQPLGAAASENCPEDAAGEEDWWAPAPVRWEVKHIGLNDCSMTFISRSRVV